MKIPYTRLGEIDHLRGGLVDHAELCARLRGCVDLVGKPAYVGHSVNELLESVSHICCGDCYDAQNWEHVAIIAMRVLEVLERNKFSAVTPRSNDYNIEKFIDSGCGIPGIHG